MATVEIMKCVVNEIDNYAPKAIDLNANIMTYWESKKYVYPYLYKIATILHSVPATQVSVERAFSALRLVLSDLRSNMSSDTLAKTLFLKLNSN